MKRPMFFFACPTECIGAPAPDGTCPPNPFFEDDRFLGLAAANRTRIIGVVSGAKSISFLRGALIATVPVPGFVFDDAAGPGQYVEPAPKLNLPALAAVAGVFSFRYLHVGTSATLSEWKQLMAPVSGEFILKVTGGNFTLVDAGQIPGLNDIGASLSTITKGTLLGLTVVSPGVYTLTKFDVSNNRPIVGDTSGTAGFKQLADADFLIHPKARFTTFQCRTFETLDNAGSAIVGGIEQALTTGASAVTDAIQMIYTPTLKRIMKAPARVFSFTENRTTTTTATPTSSYAPMPGGHGIAPALDINYPNVRIDVLVQFSNELANQTLALYKDGSLLYEWSYEKGCAQSLTYFDTGVTLASHTYDVRWKQGSAAVSSIIKYTSMAITTVP